MKPFYERPVAAPGLLSYRYRGQFGWVMIGATDDRDALHQASRSVSTAVDPSNLQAWIGESYVPVTPSPLWISP